MGQTQTDCVLVETVRTEAGPPQHLAAYPGELEHDQERRRQCTVVFRNRHGEDRQLHLLPTTECLSSPNDRDSDAGPEHVSQ